MIIIEGTDGVGKTTLAQKLVQGLQMEYHHLSRLPDSFHRYWGYIDLLRPSRVFDRLHMSELAYILGRDESLQKDPRNSPMFYSAVDRACLANGGLTILLTAEPKLLKRRWDERDPSKEMYSEYSVIKKANDAYKKIAEGENLFGYTPWFDLHFHLTSERPYVADDDLNFIAALHQAAVNRAAFARTTAYLPIPVPAKTNIITPDRNPIHGV